MVLMLRHFPIAASLIFDALKRPRPIIEPYAFWLRYMAGFNRPCRDLTEADVSFMDVSGARLAVEKQLAQMRKTRFLTKYTGWSRIGLMDAAFPGALFLNVIRDGRAVAWSLLHMPWWLGWRGPQQWRWGLLSRENQEIWERSGNSFFVLAGLQWKILMENLRSAAERLGQRYLEVRYEDLVDSPVEVVSQALNWAGLSPDMGFLEKVKSAERFDANKKWRNEVGPVQRSLFESLLGSDLERFGYLIE